MFKYGLLSFLKKYLNIESQPQQGANDLTYKTLRRWNNAGLIVGQRLRRWPTIKSALDQTLVIVEN